MEMTKGWVARDLFRNTLVLYDHKHKPFKGGEEGIGIWRSYGSTMYLPETMFPNQKWEDEPLEVEIFINPLK